MVPVWKKINKMANMNIAEHLKHNYTLTRSCKEIGAFGETGEPHIFIDRDVWDRGLVVPACPSLRGPCKPNVPNNQLEKEMIELL
jgi:hypothetical protein